MFTLSGQILSRMSWTMEYMVVELRWHQGNTSECLPFSKRIVVKTVVHTTWLPLDQRSVLTAQALSHHQDLAQIRNPLVNRQLHLVVRVVFLGVEAASSTLKEQNTWLLWFSYRLLSSDYSTQFALSTLCAALCFRAAGSESFSARQPLIDHT